MRDIDSDEMVSNLGLVGGLQKPEDRFHVSKNVTDDDCFLLPQSNDDKVIIDFYGVSEDPNLPVLKLQKVLVNADDDLRMEPIMDRQSKPDKARFLRAREPQPSTTSVMATLQSAAPIGTTEDASVLASQLLLESSPAGAAWTSRMPSRTESMRTQSTPCPATPSAQPR